jgi:hypothetical protein
VVAARAGTAEAFHEFHALGNYWLNRQRLTLFMVNSPLDNNTARDGPVTLPQAVIAAKANTTTNLGQIGSVANEI